MVSAAGPALSSLAQACQASALLLCRKPYPPARPPAPPTPTPPQPPPPPAAQVPLERWYQFLHGAISVLANVPAAEMALQLFLAAAHSASEEAGLEMTAYEFFEQVRAGSGAPGGGVCVLVVVSVWSGVLATVCKPL